MVSRGVEGAMPPLPPRSENLSHLPNPCARVKFIQDAKVLVDKARPEVDHVKRRVMGVNTPMQVHNGEGRLEPYLYVFVALAGLPGMWAFMSSLNLPSRVVLYFLVPSLSFFLELLL